MSQELKNLLKTKILIGQVYSLDEVNGIIEVSYLTQTGFKKFNVPSVFVGNDSWIRAYPQIGSYVLIADTDDEQYPEIIKVFDPSEKTRYVLDEGKNIDENSEKENTVVPFDRVSAASNTAKDDLGKIGYPYRRLKAGELEASSSGKASWWLGSKGELTLKGGLSKLEMDPFKNTIETYSTGHSKLGLDSTIDSQADQEYFGVVRRPTENKISLQYSINYIDTVLKKLNGLEISYDKIKSSINDLKNNIIENQKDLENKYKFVKDLVLEASLSTSVAALTELLDIDTQSYILSLRSLSNYGKTYLLTSTTLDNLDTSIATLDSWKSSIQEFINRTNRPQEQGNDEANLIKELRGGNILTPPEDIDIETISSNLTEQIIGISLEELTLRKSGLKKEQSKYELEASNSTPDVQEIQSRFLYPKLISRAQAGSSSIFAKEYRVNVSWKNPDESTPTPLYEKIAGHVYDANGQEERYASRPLRSRETFFTETGESSTNVYVDTEGNVTTYLGSQATRGYTLMTDKGSVKITTGGNLEITANSFGSTEKTESSVINIVNGSLLIQAGQSSINLSPDGTITIKGNLIKLEGNVIENKAEVVQNKAEVVTNTGQTYGKPSISADPDNNNKAKQNK